MKVVYYRYLIARAKNLSPNEKIIYSFLAAKSIEQIDGAFYYDGGTLRIENLSRIFDENNNRIKVAKINHSKLSRELHITRRTIIKAFHNLIKYNFIRPINGELKIYVCDDLINGGYFELLNLDKLSGELLVFYSFLKDKSKDYDNCIDTFKYKIAEQFGKSEIAITKLLHRLYKLGLAERLKDNKLLIN